MILQWWPGRDSERLSSRRNTPEGLIHHNLRIQSLHPSEGHKCWLQSSSCRRLADCNWKQLSWYDIQGSNLRLDTILHKRRLYWIYLTRNWIYRLLDNPRNLPWLRIDSYSHRREMPVETGLQSDRPWQLHTP